MTITTETLISEIQRSIRHHVDEANRLHRLAQAIRRAPMSASVPLASDAPDDLVEVGVAAQWACKQKDTVRLWCRQHPFDRPGGFGFKMRGRWMVSEAPFRRFLKSGA